MRQRIHSSSSENTKQGNPSPLLTRSATVTAQTDLQRSRFPENADNEAWGQKQSEPPITAPLMSFDWTKIPVDAPGHPTTIPIQPKFLGQISHYSGQIPFPIQAKLTIGQPNDRYEQEADRMARQVVSQINRPAAAPADATVQRQDIPEDEERLQRKASLQNPADGMAAPPELEAEIGRSRSGGQPLATEVRHPMEQAFGADFSGVKLHTDAQADQLNRSIQAKAFTTGHNIFFRQGAYQPGSRGGQELIAHELTHVMQQSGELRQQKSTVDQMCLKSGNNIKGQEIANSINKKGPVMMIQAKGFKSVNNIEAKDLVKGTSEEYVAQAGMEVWDTVFTNDQIDKEGGIKAMVKAEAEKKLSAEAVTRYENDDIGKEAFALVSIEGDLEKGTEIERWNPKKVQGIEGGKVALPVDLMKTKEAEIKRAIHEGIMSVGKKLENEAEGYKEIDDLMLLDDKLEDWYVSTNKKTQEQFINDYYTSLEQKIFTDYPKRKGTITSSYLELVTTSNGDKYGEQVFRNITTLLGITGEDQIIHAPETVSLPLNEVVMHEFGHVNAALSVSKESIEAFKINPTKEDAIKVAKLLLKKVEAKDLNRDWLTALRFRWNQIVTVWYRIKDSDEYVKVRQDTTDALKIMANILMSFEEYYNIQDIDNKKALTSGLGKRLAHGTEIATGMDLGMKYGEINELTPQLANTKEGLSGNPVESAEFVWLTKLKILLDRFISRYSG